MTHSDIGRELKQIHPGFYDDIHDGDLGQALQRKHPDLYGHVRSDNLGANTVPETPATLKLQLDQLANGIRRVVFIARGSKVQIDPKQFGARKVLLPPGEFIYDPRTINAKEIIAAVRDHSLNEILGSAENGYAAPSKEDLQGEPMAVVAKDATGETAQSALTDPQHMQETIEAAGDVTPEGGNVTVEPPHVEIEHRITQKKAGRWLKPGGKVKLPPGESQ